MLGPGNSPIDQNGQLRDAEGGDGTVGHVPREVEIGILGPYRREEEEEEEGWKQMEERRRPRHLAPFPSSPHPSTAQQHVTGPSSEL
ncbi:hypothetical protein BHM03_00011448 [Ensete ventricosum]|nr:hypothetical protein BHM03_00011448 [Ensete ventricosum]